ncbi:hypothetical protein B9T31_14360 [Acinetobacter sp. ANC 4558]|uniref:fimbrial protein n=1 Tax=Acinetobacter sp. ANC 4558 TaxID=1977876 RepID=UPI000A355F26|nr:fimbrial protein [Acinetobacter sp. ANC 4558]OTG82481.1 hypothetical protein B9T31_14360 [Acinetobacter sp. ANC 4558]
MKLKKISSTCLILGIAFITKTYAACTPIDGFITTVVQMKINQPIIIRPSDPIGKSLATAIIPYTRDPNSTYYCTSRPTINGVLTKNPTISNLGNNIYSTNIQGIGIRLSRATQTTTDVTATLKYPYSVLHANESESYPTKLALASGNFFIEIIKTSQNTGSGEISPGQYTSHFLDNNLNKPSLITVLGAKAITIASSSCEIQGEINKVITLPTVTQDKFKGMGTTTGEQSFNLDILCNGGANPTNVQASNKISLSYDFTANSDLKSIVNSAPTNTKANGVSVQLINKDNNANTIISKGSTFTLGTVNSNQRINYNVPLTARYIQTAQTITPGLVQGLATVTIEYQ